MLGFAAPSAGRSPAAVPLTPALESAPVSAEIGVKLSRVAQDGLAADFHGDFHVAEFAKPRRGGGVSASFTASFSPLSRSKCPQARDLALHQPRLSGRGRCRVLRRERPPLFRGRSRPLPPPLIFGLIYGLIYGLCFTTVPSRRGVSGEVAPVVFIRFAEGQPAGWSAP